MQRSSKSDASGAKRIEAWDIEVARRIRALRIESGVSQQVLGARLGLTAQQVQKYEKGANRVSAGRLQHIARIFNVPAAFFFDEELNRASPRRQPESVFPYLQSDQAVRMAKAFHRISGAKLRSSLVTLLEQVADQAQGGKGRFA